jgi:hypothetical protein
LGVFVSFAFSLRDTAMVVDSAAFLPRCYGKVRTLQY